MLGPNPELRWMNGNTVLARESIRSDCQAINGRQRQFVHADLVYDDHLEFPFACTVNFYLKDCGPENGATEWWLGTHKRGCKGIRQEPEKFDLRIRFDELEKQRMICPPVRPTVPQGSIIIRDIRTWHAGVPNESDVPRIMFGWVQLLGSSLIQDVLRSMVWE